MESATALADDDAAWDLVHAGRLAYVEERLGVTGFRPTLRQRVRRALFYVVLVWATPFALSFVPSGASLRMPFALDIEAHVRGLVAVPLLLLAEWPIEQRLRIVMRRLGSPPLMRQRGRKLLGERIRWARRVGGHPLAEGALLVLAFAAGYRWLAGHEFGLATWISTPRDGVDTVTPAGAWMAGVVVPAYSFLLLRWLWRWVVLAALFARVSRLPLRLVANHGDCAAGLGFVSEASVVFAWVLVAASSVVCAKGMDAIIYAGMSPGGFMTILQVIVVLGVLWAFLPLLAFTPRLVVAKRNALRRYTDIVAKHGTIIERRWRLPGDSVTSEDAESMANLNSVHATVRAIRIVPVGVMDLVAVAAAAMLPLVPVILQIIPARELAARLLKALV